MALDPVHKHLPRWGWRKLDVDLELSSIGHLLRPHWFFFDSYEDVYRQNKCRKNSLELQHLWLPELRWKLHAGESLQALSPRPCLFGCQKWYDFRLGEWRYAGGYHYPYGGWHWNYRQIQKYPVRDSRKKTGNRWFFLRRKDGLMHWALERRSEEWDAEWPCWIFAATAQLLCFDLEKKNK